MTLLAERIRTNAWATQTVQAILRETCQVQPEKTALLYSGTEMTYRELQERVDSLTLELQERGISRGDVVSVLPSPTPDSVIVYFAVLQAAAIINPLNLLWSAQEFTAIVKRNAPKAIIAVDEYAGRNYLQVVEESLGESQPLLIAAGEPATDSTWLRLNDLLNRAPSANERAAIEQLVASADSEDIQFICQTSGSTGLSKSALWNHRPPLATANFAAAATGLTPEDKYLNAAPFFHNSGICTAMTMAVAYAGITLQLFDSFNPNEALEAIATHGLTTTFGFAAHWKALRQSPNFNPETFSMSKVILAGDAKLYDNVREMCGPDATLVNLYAQTENGPLVSLTELGCIDENLRRNNSGRPLPGVEVVIRDLADDSILADGQPGEICYRSPFLFQGYLQEDGTHLLPLDEDGYFRSGDYGQLDGGYLTYIERLGGVVKSGGENVSLAQVTSLLQDTFSNTFDNVLAVAVPDDYWGSMVVALVRCSETTTLDRDELREACRNSMARYEIPQQFIRYDGPWPVTPEGKMNVKALNRYAEEAVAAQTASA